MRINLAIQVRAFPVTVQDGRTGETITDTLVLDKQQLQAAQLVGQSSKELIHRLYERQGFKVTEIGKPEKRTINVNLEELYQLHGGR
ncbi:MAG: hypothetical protein VB096_10310 [Pseudoflavonifractor sp.]|nr:hypothetical protein [Pseudoflavonifractor sp.]